MGLNTRRGFKSHRFRRSFLTSIFFHRESDRIRNIIYRTGWQVAHSEAVLDVVAGLAVTPTLQAGVLLLRRLQHVVAAQTLMEGKGVENFTCLVHI